MRGKMRKTRGKMEITIKDLRHWNDDFKEGDLERRIVKLKTISTSKRYPDGYTYREAVRRAILEDGKIIDLTIHERDFLK
ncbi:MAG: hypothetical protein DRO95_05390 [Candidatus Altiarchaeales archaeon]|nr:MAG: hypothetical protein DRO95_05390 [Candidatus Altiarchaeales archaeon]